MLVNTYNSDGVEQKKTKLPAEMFSVEMNSDLLYQVIVSQASNRRQGTSHVKDRSEVRGGGKKPWRQKGTGKARHGSIRSPIWIGGGVIFGPRKTHNFKKKIPKQMKRKALFIAFSEKAKKGGVILMKDLRVKEGKTKEINQVISNLSKNVVKDLGSSALLVLPEKQEEIVMASRNIPGVETIQAKDLNSLDVMKFKYLLVPLQSIEVMKNTFIREN